CEEKPMADMDLFEALRTTRTVRRLKPDPVPDDLLRKVLTAATWAPSGGNRQPWRFLVVRDAERRRQLRELYLPLWRTFSGAYTARLSGLPPEARAREERMVRSADHLAEHLHEVTVIVVLCLLPSPACALHRPRARASPCGRRGIDPPGLANPAPPLPRRRPRGGVDHAPLSEGARGECPARDSRRLGHVCAPGPRFSGTRRS